MTSVAYAALWLFVFTVPWETILVIPGMALMTRLTGVLAATLAVLAFVATGKARTWQPFHIWAVLFVMWVGCGLLFFYGNWQKVPDKFWTYVQLLVVLWIVWEVAPSRNRQLGLLAAYVLGAYVAAIDTIMVYRRQSDALLRFAAGEADPNDVAMTLALALPIAWYLGMTYRRPLFRWAFRLFIPVGLLAVGLTGSRGGMVASVVALLIVPLSLPRLSPGRRAIAIILMLISGAVALTYVPESIIQRLATTRSEVEEGRIGGRFKLWRAGIIAFTHRPIVGYGPGSYKRAVAPWLTQQSQVAHNSFISLLVEQGIVGLLLFSMMMLAVFVAILDLPPLERRFGLILLATLVIAMLPLTWENRKPVWVILALLLGLARATGVPAFGAMRQAFAQRYRSAPPAARGPLGPVGVPGGSVRGDAPV